MNHAYVDGSYSGPDHNHDNQEHAGAAGWGIVLLLPGQPSRRLQGRIEVGNIVAGNLPPGGAEDNNATELRAVLEALRHAPAGEPLTVHSDNTSTLRSIRLGSLRASQHGLAAAIRQEAQERGTVLHLARESRERRHMKAAHELANEARKTPPGAPLSTDQATRITAEALIVQMPWRAEATVTLRRAGERVRLDLPLDPAAPLPPSAQALLGAVGLAQQGELLLLRRVSALAQAIWEKPLRALEGEARAAVLSARRELEDLGVTVLFGV